MNEVTIKYCKPCGYLKRAEKMAELLSGELKIESRLIPGAGGIFEITVNGNVVARKTKEGFPDNSEIVALVSAALD